MPKQPNLIRIKQLIVDDLVKIKGALDFKIIDFHPISEKNFLEEVSILLLIKNDNTYTSNLIVYQFDFSDDNCFSLEKKSIEEMKNMRDNFAFQGYTQEEINAQVIQYIITSLSYINRTPLDEITQIYLEM